MEAKDRKERMEAKDRKGNMQQKSKQKGNKKEEGKYNRLPPSLSLRRIELLHVPHQETILPLNQRLCEEKG